MGAYVKFKLGITHFVHSYMEIAISMCEKEKL